MELTFENLPKAVTDIQEAVHDIKKLLLEKKTFLESQSDMLFTVKDAAQFLTLSVPTIYSLISKGELPVMKRSKRCYFSKQDLLDYLKAGRKKTISEIEIETDTYLSKRKKSR